MSDVDRMNRRGRIGRRAEERRAHRRRERAISWDDSVGSGGLLGLPSSVLTSPSSARGAPASSIASKA